MTIRRWVDFYREMGYNPLPSSCAEKRPICQYRDYWEAPAPNDIFDRYPTTNIQVMTGARWRLLVIDIDGADGPAMGEWWRISRSRQLPGTWITCSGGRGLHIWYRAECNIPIGSCTLWKGDGKHQAIEVLYNRRLIVAPPSIHPVTARQYCFLKTYDPQTIRRPVWLPTWLRHRLEGLVVRHCTAMGCPTDYPEAIMLARSWGVRFTGKSRNEWHECHAIDREDRRPSAVMNGKSGYYIDSGTNTKLDFPSLAVKLGVYRSVHEARQSLR